MGMRQLHDAWLAFQGIVQEDGTLKILAVRDHFIVSSDRKCCEVVISIEGYLATVMFLEATLARLEARLGSMCKLAESMGLLNDVKPETWETVSSGPPAQLGVVGQILGCC